MRYTACPGSKFIFHHIKFHNGPPSVLWRARFKFSVPPTQVQPWHAFGENPAGHTLPSPPKTSSNEPNTHQHQQSPPGVPRFIALGSTHSSSTVARLRREPSRHTKPSQPNTSATKPQYTPTSTVAPWRAPVKSSRFHPLKFNRGTPSAKTQQTHQAVAAKDFT